MFQRQRNCFNSSNLLVEHCKMSSIHSTLLSNLRDFLGYNVIIDTIATLFICLSVGINSDSHLSKDVSESFLFLGLVLFLPCSVAAVLTKVAM